MIRLKNNANTNNVVENNENVYDNINQLNTNFLFPETDLDNNIQINQIKSQHDSKSIVITDNLYTCNNEP